MIRRLVTMCICILIMTTGVAKASVRITEIAWMGTTESQFAEWFELFNDSNDEVNLSGWKLYEDGGEQLVFTLAKTISGSGYLLVERTTASSPDPIPEINDESGPFGGSGFSNTGENLVLKDNQSSSVQTLNFLSGWPAGDVETKKTMQWDGTKWVTASATPKAPLQTSTSDDTPSGQDKPSGSAWTAPKIEPKVEFSIPKTIYSTVSYEYNAKTFLEYGEAYNGVFLWNMGDGTVYKSNKYQSINHVYKYPGTYTISFAYYKNPYDKKPFLSNSIERSVVTPKILFSIVQDKGFQFSNTDSVPIDISGWVISLQDKTVELPAFTIVGSKSTIIMPFTVFSLINKYTKGILQTPERAVISEYNSKDDTNKESLPVISKISKEVKDQEIYNGLTASSEPLVEGSPINNQEPKEERSPTKILIFVGLLIVIISLFIFSERLRLKQEEL